MADRSTPSDKILVDPLFVIPAGAEDQFTFSREGTDTDAGDTEEVEGVEIDSVDDEVYSGDALNYDDGYDDSDEITLEAPVAFSVISQVVRRAPGGQQVIDVVIETEDIPGATRYEIQVTKL